MSKQCVLYEDLSVLENLKTTYKGDSSNFVPDLN